MPNLPQQETIVQYVTSSSQTQYTFAFYAPEDTDIEVYYQAANAVPIPASDILDLGSDYTVTYNSDPITGGYITLLFTPTSGYYLTINRNVLATFNYDFSAAQALSGATLDSAFDRLFLLIQQNQNYILERNLSYIINSYLPNASPYTQLPALAQNYIWVGSGSGVVAAQIAQVPSASLLQSMLANASPSTDGARLVGYYNASTSTATTVDAQLTALIGSVFTLIGVQGLTSSGTYTPTVGTVFCWARGVGAGGGGAGATSGSGNQCAGSGGSGGAYGEALFAAASLSYTIGLAGAGGAASLAGGNGGNTIMGSVLNLGGGSGGQPLNNAAVTSFVPGVTGGTVNVGFADSHGNGSGYGFVLGSLAGGASGSGADSQFGSGGLAVTSGNSATSQNGNNAIGYGAGGSGALGFGAVNVTGGAGGNGIIYVFEFG